MYNTPIFVSIFPPLNDYIRQVLQSAQHLLKARHLHQVQVVIYGQYEDQLAPKVIERYVFDMQPATGGSIGQTNGGAWTEPDEFLINWEEEARRALVILDQTVKGLKPLRDMETSFKIFVETSETAFVEMTNNSKLQVMSIWE